ncbi:MAG TPA: isoprenylcysteine carboxylmethyltransferase family protein [Anaerolineae bacterium]|nr:isoprenylcysteine carboxylmethyltransferase family protein [Anaerolineae bacterium]
MKKRIRPPHVAYAVLGLTFVAHILFPIRRIIDFPHTLWGIPLAILGLVINGWASALLYHRKTTLMPFEKPSALVVDGPYGFSRNPIYLSAVVLTSGIVVLLGSLTVLPAPIVLLLVLDVMFVRHEERNLEATFGVDYLEYKKRVRRWL